MANLKYVLTIDGKQFRFQEDQTMGNYTLTLEKLSYDKGIYRPAEMKVTMNVSGQNVKNSDLVSAFQQKIVKLTIDDETVADDYFVFNVKPVFKKVSTGSSVKLELTIFSRDKLLALDKYSKAWSDKKLGVDIFSKEVDSFNLGLQTCKNLQVVEYNKEVGTDEFVQPYLVQYNESFYDFIRRTANRCGEFLYHENGQLHLGMQMSDKAGNGDPDYAQIASERYYENILQEGTETTDYSYNYFDDNHPTADSRPYNNPLPYDDYLHATSKEFTNMEEQMGFISKNIASAIIMVLGGKSLADIIGDFGVTIGLKFLLANSVTVGLNEKHKKNNIDPWNSMTDQLGGDSVMQFGTMNKQSAKNNFSGKEINMNADFYGLMRKAEKKVAENAVYLEFGADAQKLSIGDKIKVDGEYYVVIGVNGSCDFIYTDDSKKATYEEHQQVIGVKLYGEAAIPPALPDIVVRESQPQLAFVVDNFDPEKLGRVRVKFAWQPKEEANDNKNDASPWIRVSLPFATNGGGVKFKPEKGDEVLVSFEEGNVERPYVSGSLLSPKANASWSWLPDRTITSKNGHNITFNDNVDGASFFYALSPALKSLKSFIPTSVWSPGWEDVDVCRGLSGGMTISDRFGLYTINLSSSNRSVAIQSAMGDVKLSAFTGISISAPNGDIKIEGKNVSISANNKVTIESGKAVKDRFFATENIYEEEGVKWNNRGIKFATDLITGTVRGAINRTFGNVIDAQLLRTVLEVFLRPIDGTAKIKSTTFVHIEAGKGSTEYPREARRASSDEFVALDLHKGIKDVSAEACSRVQKIKSTFKAVHGYVQKFSNYIGQGGVNQDQSVISLNTIKNASYKAIPDPLNIQWPNELKTEADLMQERDNSLNDLANSKPKNEDYLEKGMAAFAKDINTWMIQENAVLNKYEHDLQIVRETKKNRETCVTAANNLSTAINNLYRAVAIDFKADIQVEGTFRDCNSITNVFNNMVFPDPKDKITMDMTENADYVWSDQKKHFMRKAVATFLSNGDLQKKVNDYNFYMDIKTAAIGDNLQDEVAWGNTVDNMVQEVCNNAAKKDLRTYKEWAKATYWSSWVDPLVNRKRWKVGVQGKILFSDNSQKTISFGDNGGIITTENATFTNKSHKKMREFLKSIGTNVE